MKDHERAGEVWGLGSGKKAVQAASFGVDMVPRSRGWLDLIDLMARARQISDDGWAAGNETVPATLFSGFLGKKKKRLFCFGRNRKPFCHLSMFTATFSHSDDGRLDPGTRHLGSVTS